MPGRQTLVVTIAISSLAGSIASAETSQERPPKPLNILWIIAENLGPDFGCYGTANVVTPHIDRLASEGVLYTRAYTTAPVCSASRSAFMTGMYQTSIGAHNHRSHRDDGYRLPEGVRLLTNWFRDGGYFTANIRRLPATVGFRGKGKTDWNFHYDDHPFDSDDWADLKQSQPFFAQVNLDETDRPFQSPQRVDPKNVELAPYYPDHPVTRRDWAGYLDAICALDEKVGKLLELLEADGLSESTLVVFFGDNGQDHVRGIQFCYEDGLHVPLMIRWPSGIAAPSEFRAGTRETRLIEAIDLAPTMLALAGMRPPENMQGRVFLGPLAMPPRRYAFAARDRCDETVFRLRTVRDERYRYIRNFTPERPFLQANAYKERMFPVWNLLKELDAQGRLTPAQQFLTAPRMPEEELYDLNADPHQIQNLATSPQAEHQAALRRLREAVTQWIEDTDDQGRFFEPEAIAAARGATKPGTDPNSGTGIRRPADSHR